MSSPVGFLRGSSGWLSSWRWTRRRTWTGTCLSRQAPSFAHRRFLFAVSEVQENAEEEVMLSKRAFLQQEGFTDPQIKAVLDVGPRSDKLALLLLILKDRGISGRAAGSLLSSHPTLLKTNLLRFNLLLQILEDAGVEPSVLQTTLLRRAVLFRSRKFSEEGLKACLLYLKDLGLSPHQSLGAIFRSIRTVGLANCKHLVPRCQFLYEKGMPKNLICRFILNYPRVFVSPETSFMQKVQLVDEFGLGLDSCRGARALGFWHQYRVENIHAKFNFLKTLGLSDEDARQLVKKHPEVLCMREQSMKKRMEFLLATAKLSIKELGSASLFSCNLEKRVIPRFHVLQDLRNRKLLRRHVSLSCVVAMSNQAFAKRFNVDPHLMASN